MNYLLYYLVFMNILAFFLYGIDKKRAQKQQWRISERALILVAVIGGTIGALLGMNLFRHKTKHLKFVIGVPMILFVQIVMLVFAVFR